jgi:hypothetical protein
MIYIYKNNNSISFIEDETTLTEEDKKGATAIVDKLPLANPPQGYYSVLDLDENNKPFWKYKKEEHTPEMKVRLGLITKEEYKSLTGQNFIF